MNKLRNKELDVDFIGDQKPLTQAEHEQISTFIRSRRTLLAKKKQPIRKRINRSRVTA
jgi:hypothetical protein